MQGDARVVQLPDDHGHVFPTAGRCQQQLMHLERHAHILAVRVVEQPARKGTQSLDIRFGQGGRVTVVDKLRQQCLILPHQGAASQRVGLDLFQHGSGSFALRKAGPGDRAHNAQIPNILFKGLCLCALHLISPFLPKFVVRFENYNSVYGIFRQKSTDFRRFLAPPPEYFYAFIRHFLYKMHFYRGIGCA